MVHEAGSRELIDRVRCEAREFVDQVEVPNTGRYGFGLGERGEVAAGGVGGCGFVGKDWVGEWGWECGGELEGEEEGEEIEIEFHG